MGTKNFYDQIAPLYHLIYTDWDSSIARQAKALDGIIRLTGISVRDVLDVACGIGTQSLGLARLGYRIEASDLSPSSILRARRESTKRSLKIKFSVGDMTRLNRFYGRNFDMVMACDNALPHLLTDQDISRAFTEAKKCLRPGGIYLISVRDYDSLSKSGTQFKSYGTRKTKDGICRLFQIWQFKGTQYDLALYTIEQGPGQVTKTRVARATYNAVGIRHLKLLMNKAGFNRVKRIDNLFFQPVLVGIA
jgi:ubiquinone/menaquinone biosynthesis C-methylase UbiE